MIISEDIMISEKCCLKVHNKKLPPEIGIWSIHKKTIIEAPVYLGRCQLEVGMIGAFTGINVSGVTSESTNCRIECKSIGRFCSIAHSVNIGMIGHPVEFLSTSGVFKYDERDYRLSFFNNRDTNVEADINTKYCKTAYAKPLPIIGNDVWIGFGATVMNGVTVGDGSVIAARALVTKDVPPYAIVGGYQQEL